MSEQLDVVIAISGPTTLYQSLQTNCVDTGAAVAAFASAPEAQFGCVLQTYVGITR